MSTNKNKNTRDIVKQLCMDLGYDPNHVSAIRWSGTTIEVERAIWDEDKDGPRLVKYTDPFTGERSGQFLLTTDEIEVR
ncbi:hypothetical protein FB00_11275 [Cellulosimicrobium funkei]|uniref:Uncharacterized protein n=1 Tax=Cellulosimicrobium funkei TaxID=264251 RepID=A0A0H2KM28_9MICO|nr:hypothetical protein [Cellulosimicrobium funkei]KLN34580.1 hypothetical protein FB00_11275 [Cellulosimicrobium funkei]